MATISNTLRLQDKMSSTLSTITKAMNSTLLAMQSIKGANLGAEFKNAANDIKLAQKSVDDFNKSLKQGQGIKNTSAIDVFMGNMLTRGIDLAIQGTKKLVSLSDTYVSNTARLDRMNDGLQTTAELQNMIYDAAQRSRGSYNSMMSTVAQLGNQAGDAFGNNSKQIVAFGELLNKTFTLSGMDTTAIESTMYNLTQSLSSGKLLGNDYRILKQNAPQLIQYLTDYYQVSRAELDEMVSQGKVTAEGIKQAMFSSAESINEQFEKMPMTWGQLWTKATNEIQKSLEPLLKIINDMVQFISNNWDTIKIVIEGLAISVAVLTGAWVLHKAELIANTIAAEGLSATLGKLSLKTMLIAAAITALITALVYLWNTNDEAAYYMLLAWDGLQIGIMTACLVAKSAFYSVLDGIEYLKIGGLALIDSFINQVIYKINKLIDFVNMIPGVSIDTIDYTSQLATNAAEKANKRISSRADEIATDTQALLTKTQELNQTRQSRVDNRKKVGEGLGEQLGADFTKSISDSGLVGTDSAGGKALKTTSNDKLLTDEDIQLLLDVATRDYQLNYQQVTPNISVSFGDVRETVDVDSVLDAVGTRVEEIVYGDMEVANG